MRIGINARYIQSPYGIATYLLNLILNLKKIDNKNEYVLFFSGDRPIPEVILGAGFDYDISKIPTSNQILKLLWPHLYLPYVIKKNKIDLFHESSFIAPVFKRCPTVITVYDIAYLYIPSCFTYRQKLYFRSLLSGSIKRSDLIIAISENTKKDIINNFAVSPDKVQLVYGGVDETFRPFEDREELERIRKVYKIKGDFILSVSGITPRKNFIRLIKAFKLLKDQRKIDAQLVVVGGKGWSYEGVFREVALSGLEEEVIFCGYVPKEHLLCLYNMADVFVFPSLYEGFGLPILEAMACATPVVASNASSMPEVCGEAALMVDPHNIEELASAISEVRDNVYLRQALVEKGLEQVNKFSWKKTAEETLAAYVKAYALSQV